MEVFDGEETIAYAWLHDLFVDDDVHVMEFHACAHPDHHGRWMTPHTLDVLWSIALGEGATHVVAQVTSPTIASMWSRVGAEVYNKVAILKLKEN